MENIEHPLNLLPDTLKQADPDLATALLYRVIIHNDDLTPMDFVLRTLEGVFLLDHLAAYQIMFTAHHQGQAHVQTLPKPEAIRRVGLAHLSASLNRYPLAFTIEVDAP